LAAQTLWDASSRLVYPGLRLGVTGLSRSGKTVFTTALIHNLMNNGSLPAFHAAARNAIRRTQLIAQPDVTIPRFPFEDYLNSLIRERKWPPSTERISELRLNLEYMSSSSWTSSPSYLTLDIVDYPGEWLLDLTLLDQDYRSWSLKTLENAQRPDRKNLAHDWLDAMKNISASDTVDEAKISHLCNLFKSYLKNLRNGPEAIAVTPPGRFLMPGDLAGSPALTFFPIPIAASEAIGENGLASLMDQRFEAYKDHVVKPFFRDHFQRIDRQIVLVDILAALDEGITALRELESAIDNVLLAFRIGKRSLFSSLFSPRADKILFAATKADHIHHDYHGRLNAILNLLVSRAIQRSRGSGAEVGTLALASVRATKEKTVTDHGEILKAIAGIPETGERVGEQIFDGQAEVIIFPGDIPEQAQDVFSGSIPPGSLRFPRFRPPVISEHILTNNAVIPHIRLDKALEFLIGDYLT
jgi:Predicted ATPase